MLAFYFQLLAISSLVAASPRPVALKADDVVLLGADGTSSIIKDYEYADLVARGELQPAPRTMIESSVSPAAKIRRGCEESSEVQVTSDTKFLNWDVALSPVVSASGGAASVSVSSGYSIANTLSVGTSVSSSIVEDVLSVSMSIDYSTSWTSTQTSSITYEVPDGKFGLIVSQAMVRRVTGNYLDGCTGTWTKSAFTSDSYTSQSFGDLSWVQGVFKLCSSDTYPVPYCIGTGSHS